MTANKNIILPLALIIFNAVYVSQLVKLPLPFAQGEPGPAFLPILLSLVFFIASIAILIEGLKSSSNNEVIEGSFLRPTLVIVSTAIFITLLNYAGYWVAAPVYGFSVAMIFEFSTTKPLSRHLGVSILISGGLTVFGWLFFEKLFDLSLPSGVL